MLPLAEKIKGNKSLLPTRYIYLYIKIKDKIAAVGLPLVTSLDQRGPMVLDQKGPTLALCGGRFYFSKNKYASCFIHFDCISGSFPIIVSLSQVNFSQKSERCEKLN